MPNIANALKSEISRIARKEVRSEVQALRQFATAHRKEITALKRRAHVLEQLLRRVGRSKAPPEAPAAGASAEGLRFSGKGLAAHRKRLNLSAAEVGLLLGTSGQTIYNWEQGKARPRAGHLPAIAALRTLGKKDAIAVVAARSGTDPAAAHSA